MIPLIPTLALAFVSFISSAFIILRIVIPILPPSPLSRRVPPSEFGLPNFRILSPADKSHLWLAACDILALGVFLWQAIQESLGGPSDYADATDPGSAVRLWLAMTIRQTCLLVVACVTLLHIRLGRSVSLGAKHWILWAPTLLLAVTSTAVAGVLAGAGVPTFFSGLLAYSTAVAMVTSAAFGWLILTLVAIKRNLAALNEPADNWPPVREVEEKPRPSFATEDIDAIRDGSSWYTSNASSRHDSISNWSFSTHSNSRQGSMRINPAAVSHPSIAAKSSFWFNSTTAFPRESPIPPVPPLPSPYRSASVTSTILGNDPDPFRRAAPTGSSQTRVHTGSQDSWLTSPSASQVTLSQWSYPTTRPDASMPDLRADLLPAARPGTPAMANAQVLGGYGAGYAPGSTEVENGLASFAVTSSTDIDVSVYRAIGWLIIIWVPFALMLPYFFFVSPSVPVNSMAVKVLLSLSITISSPILALNLLFRSPLPIPSGLFDARNGPPLSAARLSSSPSSLDFVRGYKRSGSITVVEGRRSTDIWLSNGDAVDGKTKFGRAVGMLTPAPKLSVLPPKELDDDGQVTPPLPIQMEDETPSFGVPTPQSQNSAELGRMKSVASSHYSGADESLAYASRIMIAQKHYSTLAQTVLVQASPDKGPSVVGVTGAAIEQGSKGHLRARSISSVSHSSSTRAAPSPPPSIPLPPTPPTLKNARLAKLGHRKALSSDAFSFGPQADDFNEIDAMTAGLLPLLVPGLKVGDDMKIRDNISPASTFSKASRKKVSREFGGMSTSEEFSSPEVHSTPARKRESRAKRASGHKRNHYSLPSLGLGKGGVAVWKAELSNALESHVAAANGDIIRRATVWGGESAQNAAPHLSAVREEDGQANAHAALSGSLGRSKSTRALGLRADVPIGVNSARESVATLLSTAVPPSAASTATLFEFDAGIGSPEAESTPHDSKKNHPTSSREPIPNPLPTTRTQSKRSSIVYIKSDDDSPTNPVAPSRSFSRAVRQLVPKRSILQRKQSLSDTKPGLPGGGLRPLALLQDRDTNSPMTSSGGTRPLVLGKKKLQLKTIRDDENADPSSGNRNLKQLQLARSETSKQRGILRASETLPDVVVRPPSTGEHLGFVYGYAH